MPAAQLKKFAEKSGKSLAEVEAYWDEAKSDAEAKGLKHDDDKFWKYVSAIVQRRCGLKESISFKEFLILEKKTVQIQKNLSHKEAMKLAPWKPSYGDCRGFSYDPKTGEATWI